MDKSIISALIAICILTAFLAFSTGYYWRQDSTQEVVSEAFVKALAGNLTEEELINLVNNTGVCSRLP